MSSITSLRLLLEDQKKKEVELLKQLIEAKAKEAEEDTSQIKRDEVLQDVQSRYQQALTHSNQLQSELDNLRMEGAQMVQQITWLQHHCQEAIQRMNAFQATSSDWETKYKNSQFEIERLQSKCDDLLSKDRYYQEQMSKQGELTSTISQLESQLNQVKRELEGNKAEANRTMSSFQSNIRQLEGRLSAEGQASEGLNTRLGQSEEARQRLAIELAELNQVNQKNQALLTEISALQSKLVESEQALQAKQQVIDTSQQYLQQWAAAGQNYDLKYNLIQEQYAELASQYTQFKEEAARRTTDLERDLSTSRATVETMRNDETLLQQKISEYMIEIRTLQQSQQRIEEVSRVEKERLESTINSLQSSASELSKREATLQAQVDEVTRERRVIENKLEKAITDQENLRTQHAQALRESQFSLQSTQERSVQQLSEAERQVSTLQQEILILKKDIQRDKEVSDQRYEQLNTRYTESQTHSTKLETELSESKHKYTELEVQYKQFSDVYATEKPYYENMVYQQGIAYQTLLGQYQQVQVYAEQAVQERATLETQLIENKRLVTNNEEIVTQLRAEIDVYKQESVTKTREIEASKSLQLVAVTKCETVERERGQLKEDNDRLQRELVDANKHILDHKLVEERFQREREMWQVERGRISHEYEEQARVLRAEVLNATNYYNQALVTSKELDAKLMVSQAEVDEWRGKHQASMRVIDGFEAERKILTATTDNAMEQIRTYKEEVKSYEESTATLNRSIMQHAKNESTLQESLEAVQREKSTLDRKLSALQVMSDNTTNELNRMKMTFSSLEETYQSQQHSQVDEKEATIQTLYAQIERLTSERSTDHNATLERSAKRQQQEHEMQALQHTIQEQRLATKIAEEKLKQVEESANTARQALTLQTRTAHEYEGQIQTLRSHLDTSNQEKISLQAMATQYYQGYQEACERMQLVVQQKDDLERRLEQASIQVQGQTELTSQLSKVQTALKTMESEVVNWKNQLQAAEQKGHNYESSIEQLRKELTDKRSQLDKKEQELLDAQKKGQNYDEVDERYRFLEKEHGELKATYEQTVTAYQAIYQRGLELEQMIYAYHEQLQYATAQLQQWQVAANGEYEMKFAQVRQELNQTSATTATTTAGGGQAQDQAVYNNNGAYNNAATAGNTNGYNYDYNNNNINLANQGSGSYSYSQPSSPSHMQTQYSNTNPTNYQSSRSLF